MRWEEKDIDIQTKFQYIKSMINDITLAVQVMGKIVSGMFLTGESLFIIGLFGVAGVAFYIKAKLEHN